MFNVMPHVCPQSDSNRHWADFKSAASANWAIGAKHRLRARTCPRDCFIVPGCCIRFDDLTYTSTMRVVLARLGVPFTIYLIDTIVYGLITLADV